MDNFNNAASAALNLLNENQRQTIQSLSPELQAQFAGYITLGLPANVAYNNVINASVTTYSPTSGAGGLGVISEIEELPENQYFELKFKNEGTTTRDFIIGDFLNTRDNGIDYLNAYDGTRGANTHEFFKRFSAQRSLIITSIEITSKLGTSYDKNRRLLMYDTLLVQTHQGTYLPFDFADAVATVAPKYMLCKRQIATDGLISIVGKIEPADELTVLLQISAIEKAFVAKQNRK